MVDRARILVVDDELGPRESLRMILKPSYDVHTAEDGASALTFLEKGPVDLITLDLKMPGLSGMEVLERIRESDRDVMVIIVTGYGTFKSVVEAIRLNVFDYISKPFNIPEIVSIVERCLDMRNTKLAIGEIFKAVSAFSKADPSETNRARVIEGIQKLSGEPGFPRPNPGESTLVELIRLTSDAVERREPYMTGHSERVRQYTDSMAQRLGLSLSVREELRIACYLHDIGKVCISSRFMNEEGKLSSTDWAILRTHPIQSVELSEPLKLSPTTLLALRHHHERFDGTGYPDGLGGNDIPLGARIMALGNAYEVMTSKRPYRNAMSAAEAEAEIRKYGANYFDPDLIGIFTEVLGDERDSAQAEDSQRAISEGLS
jgi:response regulator RpfG family c-di-GMP phosphodiesterase